MNEVLLYGYIWQQSAIDFITAINLVESDELTVRINSGGGEVMYGWGMVTKFREFEGKKRVKNDGMSASMAFAFNLYTDKENIEATDVSKFLVHRASYGTWYEDNYMTESEKEQLSLVNKDLETAFRNRIDVAKFETLKNVTVKELFSMDSRIDVWLTAKEAKQIGLIGKIVTITPQKAKELNAHIGTIAAEFKKDIMEIAVPSASTNDDKPNTNQNKKTMNKEQLKAEHPAVYNEIFEAGQTAGIAQEKDRAGAWAVWSEVDPKAVAEGIKSGENISQTAMAELSMKKISADTLKGLGLEGKGTKVTATNNDGEEDGKKAPQTHFEKMQAELKDKLESKKA